MDLDPELLKKLTETFKLELAEQSQTITDNLLKLEKADGEERKQVCEIVFRAAHNIKGAARTVNMNEVGEIAHHVESLFARIQKNEIQMSAGIIDLCLEAIDAMNAAMISTLEKTPLGFEMPALLKRLETIDVSTSKSMPETSIEEPRTEESVEAKLAKKVPPTVAKPTEMGETESIRVNLGDVDRISALMEEMQINKIAIDEDYNEFKKLTVQTKEFKQVWNKTLLQIKNILGHKIGENLKKQYELGSDKIIEISHLTNQLNKDMHNQVKKLNILSTSLHDEIRLLRLIQANTLLRTFPRLVRDLAKEMNKSIELNIIGGDVKMDKMILEGLKDPLIHLLRNAIDHGIESPQVRQQHGKPETGTITIQIKEMGNQISIDLSDDGQGIDIKKIKAIAINKNLFSEADLLKLTDNEILELIFQPGFSTREIISNVSGRGVGLDVVKSNLSKLKGSVSLSTQINVGTTFHLRVPLTLTSERGLMVKSSGQVFVIPMTSVAKVMFIQSNEIITVETQPAILLDKRPVLLRNLSDLLNFSDKQLGFNDRISLIVIKNDQREIALIVEEILGEREIVIKTFQSPLSNIPCVTGAALSASGKVLIVLNPDDLINKAYHLDKTIVIRQNEEKIQTEQTHILVVDDSITTRTLEKNILESKNYKVTVATNGKEAWDILQRQNFALLITDVTMPIMDGFTLTERVKQSKELQNLPVIIVTSLNSEAEKKRGIDVGADAYLVKSEFESGSLLEIVSQLV